MSMLYFTPASMVQHIIHQFKYKGQQKLAEYMGQLMGQQLVEAGRFPALDLVLPLPLSRSREQERGYNQAALLAGGCARALGLPVLHRGLVRTRNSATQTHMDREDRWNNVKGLFRVPDPAPLKNKSILLVDDVITTGATLEACASALLAIPGCRVSIATLAYAAK